MLEVLASSLAACRARRASLSLVLLHLDGFAELVFQAGVTPANRIVQLIRAGCRQLAEGAICQQVRDERFAIVLPECDRTQALRDCDELLPVLRGILADQAGNSGGMLRLCLGVASVTLPTATFPPQELIRGATRCLNAALSSNGDCVKSIETY